MDAMRSEQSVFDDLANLCSSPGYIHAIAYLCFRDNMIRYSGEMKPDDMQHLFSMTRLIRTETSTLIGLLLKKEIDYCLPGPEALQEYLDKTEALLSELHESMPKPFQSALDLEKMAETKENPFTQGAFLREAIFYSGESAYSCQYRDLSPQKYSDDDEWFITNKGFSINAAKDIVHAIGLIQREKAATTVLEMQYAHPNRWTFLPCYTFTVQEIATKTCIDIITIRNVLQAFAIPEGERNDGFLALNDFNIVNASPLLRVAEDTYVLFHIYSIAEALYESPFYWMHADSAYVNTAMQHRGRFPEIFAANRLAMVFGKENVFSNIDIFKSKGKKLAEIDALVLFGDRAIVLQAKSKRLTLLARKGNDQQIKDDFKASIQDSCDQAYTCAQLLQDPSCTFKDINSREVSIPSRLKSIYVLCIVADHYPALSFQTQQFLKFETTKAISPPYVLDVFTLDALTEMLDSPLQLLSYVDRRTKYYDKLMGSELTILSYHLKRNLWLGDEYDGVMLGDDISADLDLAMIVRRDGIAGNRTPDGILTRVAKTTLGCFIKEIELRPDPATIDFGYMLLTLSEKSIVEISNGIDELIKRAKRDGKNHDLTIGFGANSSGLTVHCNSEPPEIAGPRLERHCRTRKYSVRSQTWFGICINPIDGSLRFGINLDYRWEQNETMDTLVGNLPKPGKLANLLKETTAGSGIKLGRNDLCPCGSGKKFKKCCLQR